MEERYYCRDCEYTTTFDSRRKTHRCPICSEEMSYMSFNTVVGSILYRIFLPYGTKEYAISDGVKSTEWSAFQYNTTLEKITFPSGFERIPGFCLDGCKALKDITIPNTVKKIEYAAFRDCIGIKKLEMPDSLEEIDEMAFNGCDNLEVVTLPETLKKIGNDAFSSFGKSCRYKYIVLPRSLLEIGNNAFGKVDEKSQPFFLVSQNSYAEEYLKENGYRYHVCDAERGMLISQNIYNRVLLFFDKKEEFVRIGKNVSVIAPYAFSKHTEIEAIELPNTLEEIQESAFEGCKSIKQITLPDSIRRIGSKAFFDTGLKYVEVPASIIKLAPDTFPEKCMISIGGEMPDYSEKLSALEAVQNEINSNRTDIIKLQGEILLCEENSRKHEQALPEGIDRISGLQKKRDETSEAKRKKSEEKQERFLELTRQLTQINAEIENLTGEKGRCFFLAISRKKELDEKISAKQDEQKTLQAEIDSANSLFDGDLRLLNEILESVDNELYDISRKKNVWEIQNQNLKNALKQKREQIETLTGLVEKKEKTLATEREALSKTHEQWEENFQRVKEDVDKEIRAAKEKAEEEKRLTEERKRAKELASKKAKLLKSLKLPNNPGTVLLGSNDSSLDEVLLNGEYQNALNYLVALDYANVHNTYLDAHASEIEEIKEINSGLNLNRDDQLDGFIKVREPDSYFPMLPERFTKLNNYFRNEDSWKNLKKAAKSFFIKKKAIDRFCKAFFEGTDYIIFQDGNKRLLLFPSYAVFFDPKKPMTVYTYDKLKTSVKCEEGMEFGLNIPEKAELVSTHYLYRNADGSINKRYKDNPLVQEVRYSGIVFESGRSRLMTAPIKTYDAANSFLEQYSGHISNLLTGSKKKVYEAIIASKEIDEIDAKMQEMLSFEKEEKQRLLKEAKEAEKRIKEEQIAAERAAEQKKLEIIQRQKEINEERKRQAAEQKEKEKQVARLFEDDFSSPSVSEVEEEEIPKCAEDKFPIEIVSNRIISNTVFKIELGMLEKCPAGLTAYFTDKRGAIISTKKKIGDAKPKETVKLGFVLNSGIDYSTMKQCFLQFETQDGIVGNAEFKVNISFSPDEF